MTDTQKRENRRLKLRRGTERYWEPLLTSKNWRALWDYCQKKNISYYIHTWYWRVLKKIKKVDLNDLELYAIFRSHLDAAWHWTKLSSIRRMIITAQQVIENFEQYPFLKYSQTTPQYYDWIRKLRPELFEKIKQYEKDGRWCLIGGMWVEPDANLPSGESLVRQRLYGQLFYLKHFGKLAKTECLEDTFGFNAQLPQILVKSGAEAFWTLKLLWNKSTKFPFANFIWRGIDNSEIFTHVFTGEKTKYLKIYSRMARRVVNCKKPFNSSYKMDEVEASFSKDFIKACGIFYGQGDGGMGPRKGEINLIHNLCRMGLIKNVLSTDEYIQLLKTQSHGSLPIWNDELYLETHRGVYTSQANIKRLNRACEINIRNAEILLTLFTLFSNNYEYPTSKMDKLWKDILFNQFHDILPGSSKQDIYYEQEKELEDVLLELKKFISFTLREILTNFLAQNKYINLDKYGIIMNTLPWTRSGLIEVDGLKVKIKDMLPFSFRVVEPEMLKENYFKQSFNDLNLQNNENIITIENSLISLKIEKLSGAIISIKYNQYELIQNEKGMKLHVFFDKPSSHPAWDINPNYIRNPVEIGNVKEIQIIESELDGKTVKLYYDFMDSQITHYISLRAASPTLNFKTEINAQNEWLLFKVCFPFNINLDSLVGEIPYGYLKRKRIPESEMEKAKWEFSAQKYVDLSNSDYGVTLVNNSKYGFSSNSRGLYLTLLRTPIRPRNQIYSILDLVPKEERTKYVDIGSHSTEYALCFHDGDFIESKSWRKGYEYNYPLLFEIYSENIQNSRDISMSSLFRSINTEDFSIISVSNPNVILQVLKPPEVNSSKNEFIMRLFETSGIPQNSVKITFNTPIKISQVKETDLLERDINSDINILDKNEIIANFSKFEIKTIKITISS